MTQHIRTQCVCVCGVAKEKASEYFIEKHLFYTLLFAINAQWSHSHALIVVVVVGVDVGVGAKHIDGVATYKRAAEWQRTPTGGWRGRLVLLILRLCIQ